MSPEEAVIRARQKIARGEVIDEFDVANIAHSVSQDGYQQGIRSAFSQMARLCAQYTEEKQ